MAAVPADSTLHSPYAVLGLRPVPGASAVTSAFTIAQATPASTLPQGIAPVYARNGVTVWRDAEAAAAAPLPLDAGMWAPGDLPAPLPPLPAAPPTGSSLRSSGNMLQTWVHRGDALGGTSAHIPNSVARGMAQGGPGAVWDARDMFVSSQLPRSMGGKARILNRADFYAANGFRQVVTGSLDPLAVRPMAATTSAAQYLADAQTQYDEMARMGQLRRDYLGRFVSDAGGYGIPGAHPDVFFTQTRPYTYNDVTAVDNAVRLDGLYTHVPPVGSL